MEHGCRYGGSDEIGGAFDPDARIGGERGRDLTGIGLVGQVGELMDDNLGLRRARRLTQRVRVEHIHHDRGRARICNQARAGGRARCPGDVVAGTHEQGQQRPPDNAGSPRKQNSHQIAPPVLLLGVQILYVGKGYARPLLRRVIDVERGSEQTDRIAIDVLRNGAALRGDEFGQPVLVRA